MPRSGVCDEVRGVLSELALGIADGEERAQVLEHVSDCTDCRQELERQSAVADELLLLAPGQEPPIGFELEVLRSIQPEPRRNRSIFRWLVPATALLAAVLVTAGAMSLATRDDRRLADQYRATLAEANGRYFTAVRLQDAAGRDGGVLFTYRGSPSWILVTVPAGRDGRVANAEVVDRTGKRIPIGSFSLVDGVWGGALPVDLADVAALHLLGQDGRTELSARP
jgi:Putative zinc-finger